MSTTQKWNTSLNSVIMLRLKYGVAAKQIVKMYSILRHCIRSPSAMSRLMTVQIAVGVFIIQFGIP